MTVLEAAKEMKSARVTADLKSLRSSLFICGCGSVTMISCFVSCCVEFCLVVLLLCLPQALDRQHDVVSRNLHEIELDSLFVSRARAPMIAS